MPRQDVPYGGALCRLKERIAEIWDKLGEKLHSINGVEGDGAGDVKIVSGDAAITITDSPTGHYVEIGLDHGNLPSAAVSSVNGQTGAVALDGNDIETFEGSGVNVTDAIVTNVGQLNNLQGRLNQEISDRQAGDNALQASINSVQASIPGAAATAVANDPTVAQLATDVPNKVDKITSGSSLKAYTHTGATQGETSVVDETTANSIGLRDANGRMKAADPASGATDKTLVTANWVSQTGDSAPNNLLHKSANEKFNGMKTGTVGLNIASITSTNDAIFNKWFKVARVYGETYLKLTYNISFPFNNTSHMFMDISVSIPRLTNPNSIVAVSTSKVSNIVDQTYFAVAFDGSDYYLFIKTASYVYCNLYAVATAYYGALWNASDRIIPMAPVEDDPTTYQNYVVI